LPKPRDTGSGYPDFQRGDASTRKQQRRKEEKDASETFCNVPDAVFKNWEYRGRGQRDPLFRSQG